MNERFCVVSTMRNEGPFVLEWVAHYKALGFDDLVVCSNDCEDTTTELLLALQDRGLVRHHATVIPAAGSLQLAAIDQALSYREAWQASWVFVCDGDEFLNIKIGDGSVRTLVDASEKEADGIWVPWRVFGANGMHRFCDAPVKEQFLMAQGMPPASVPAGNWGKSLHRRNSSAKFSFVGVHKPNAGEHCSIGLRINLPGGLPYSENGERSSTATSFDIAQINHYALRSLDSYLIKRARGSAFEADKFLGLNYWKCFDRKATLDASILRYHRRAAHWTRMFRTDATLAALHQRAVTWYRRKAAELRADSRLHDLINAIESKCASAKQAEKPLPSTG
jgi:hypothetical protein